MHPNSGKRFTNSDLEGKCYAIKILNMETIILSYNTSECHWNWIVYAPCKLQAILRYLAMLR